MSWPLSQDYNEAIQAPATSFADPDLRRGQAVANAFGVPMPCSGNFADVYQVRCPDGARWAVKCFTREVPGLRERYAEISRHLRQAQLRFTVDFDFLEQGIRVTGRWYPVLKMEWVEGLTLNQFVARYVDRPPTLDALLQVWARMARHLRASGAAHCDLQHGNVLLVPEAGSGLLVLKLVDYDGMFVPALASSRSGEVGHPSYQHPQRAREGTYSLDVDRFPVLLIATALSALKAGGRPLWEKYDNGDNLLFTQEDLDAPSKSPLFYELLKRNEVDVRSLVEAMIEATRKPLDQAPLLEEVLPDPGPARSLAPAPITPGARRPAVPAGAVNAIPTTTDQTNESSPGEWPSGSYAGRALPQTNHGPSKPWGTGCAALGVVLVVLIGVAGAVYLASQGQSQKPAAGSAIAENRVAGRQPGGKPGPRGEAVGPATAENRAADSVPREAAKAAPAASQQPPSREIDLFNGKDLAGWDGDPSLWSVMNGELVGRSPGVTKSQFLKSRLTASDFRLTLKVKLVVCHTTNLG
jgi:hypothetical protein